MVVEMYRQLDEEELQIMEKFIYCGCSKDQAWCYAIGLKKYDGTGADHEIIDHLISVISKKG